MRKMNLRSIDLNLLVVLDHLLDTSHVTAAAERAGMSQPAMSRALQRLRAMLGDPLLVRGRDGLILTPRARALQPTLKSVLEEIRSFVVDRPFEPAQQAGRRVLVATDHQTIMLLPRLMARLGREAPRLDIKVLPASAASLEGLATGAVDLAFGVAEQALPPTLNRETLYRDRFVTLTRGGHPATGNWTLETFAGLDHVLVTIIDGERGAVDTLLDAKGLSRRIALRLPHFYAAIRIVATSDLVVTLPSTIARMFAPEFGLTVLEVPITRPPFEVASIWPQVLDKDPANRWLRAIVREEARQVPGAILADGQPAIRNDAKRRSDAAEHRSDHRRQRD